MSRLGGAGCEPPGLAAKRGGYSTCLGGFLVPGVLLGLF